MKFKMEISGEDSRVSNGIEYVTVSGREVDPVPLQQFVEYGLRQEEKEHKGKLVGKIVTIQVSDIGQIFHGRPRLSGKIIEMGK